MLTELSQSQAYILRLMILCKQQTKTEENLYTVTHIELERANWAGFLYKLLL